MSRYNESRKAAQARVARIEAFLTALEVPATEQTRKRAGELLRYRDGCKLSLRSARQCREQLRHLQRMNVDSDAIERMEQRLNLHVRAIWSQLRVVRRRSSALRAMRIQDRAA